MTWYDRLNVWDQAKAAKALWFPRYDLIPGVDVSSHVNDAPSYEYYPSVNPTIQQGYRSPAEVEYDWATRGSQVDTSGVNLTNNTIGASGNRQFTTGDDPNVVWNAISPHYVGWDRDPAVQDFLNAKGGNLSTLTGAPTAGRSAEIQPLPEIRLSQPNLNFNVPTFNAAYGDLGQVTNFADALKNFEFDITQPAGYQTDMLGRINNLQRRRPSPGTQASTAAAPSPAGSTDRRAFNVVPGSEGIGFGWINDIMGGNITGNPSEEAASELRDAKSDARNFVPENYLPGQGEFGDLYAAAQDPSEINRLLQEGKLSQEEAQRAYRDQLISGLEQGYAKLLSSYDRLVPKYRAYAEDAIGTLNKNLGRARETGERTIDEVENTYGSAIRKATKNQQLQENKLRNLFSRLGTAESSAFIEEMGKMKSDFLSNVAESEREKSGKVSGVQTKVADYERDVMDEISKIERDRDQKIQEVEESKVLSEGDKLVELQKINAEFGQNMADLQTQYNMLKANQIMNRANFADKLALIQAEGGVDQNLLRLQAGLENQAMNFNRIVPPELDQQLRSYIKAPTGNTNKMKFLMETYPQWSDIIEGVYKGYYDENDLNLLMNQRGTTPTGNFFKPDVSSALGFGWVNDLY